MILYIKGDQLNMAVFFWYLKKMICLLNTCKAAYTGHDIFYKVPAAHGHVTVVTLYVDRVGIKSTVIDTINRVGRYKKQ